MGLSSADSAGGPARTILLGPRRVCPTKQPFGSITDVYRARDDRAFFRFYFSLGPPVWPPIHWDRGLKEEVP